MTTMTSVIPAALTAAIGWGLVSAAWEGLAIGALAAVLLRIARPKGPRWRYAICCASLLACAALPLWQVLAALLAPDAAAQDPGSAPAWQLGLASHLPAIVAAWSLGAALMLARLLAGLAWVGRLRADASPAPSQWQALVDALVRRLGAPLNVVLLSVDRLAAPLTVGWWRPVVLVPAALLAGMPAPLLEALLAHELAHIARRDYLVNLVQSCIEALLFFHPVVWWLSARLRAERELVADELAAAVIGDRRRLACALEALASTSFAAAGTSLVLSARGGSLLQRIEALVAQRPRAASWKPTLVVTILSGAALLAQWPQVPAAADEVARWPREQSHEAGPASVGSGVLAPVVPPLPAAVSARHALVLDEATGQVLMARDADSVVPIASLTKLMTAMVVLDARLAPAETIRVEAVDAAQGGGSRLAVGARVTRANALVLALLGSDNGAAAALARTYPGGPGAFERALQDKIRALGLRHTTLSEPTGLSPANASTAAEVARIVAASARYPQIAAITGERGADVVVDGRARHLRNHNPLVGAAGWDIRLSKTGFTRAAGNCLTMSLRTGGRDVTLVLLDTSDVDRRLRDARAIQQVLANPGAT
jgi:serine-type D-Ala-D-Ala endopeptidase (penicillin-binding protein 7)